MLGGGEGRFIGCGGRQPTGPSVAPPNGLGPGGEFRRFWTPSAPAELLRRRWLTGISGLRLPPGP